MSKPFKETKKLTSARQLRIIQPKALPNNALLGHPAHQ
jgi:hypothetical protein